MFRLPWVTAVRGSFRFNARSAQIISNTIGTLTRVGGGGVGGLNAQNKDLIRPI